jgi:hypothetical protein
VLQGFFMALLFFIAGYFVPASYDARGAGRFLAGRLFRLGLPTALYVFAIGPVTEYYVAHSWRTQQSFAHEMGLYLLRGRFLSGSGPMWFCVALMIFSFAYAAWRSARVGGHAEPASGAGRIGPAGVGLTILAIAATTFLARMVFPVGTSVLNLQLCDFPSYVILFCLGLAARRYDWLTRVTDRFAWLTAALCVGLAMAMWLPLLSLGGGLRGDTAPYAGGLTWQSAALSVWEALICVGMSMGVLAGFRTWMAGQGKAAKFMSDNAFAVYVIHPPILIGVALALASLAPLPQVLAPPTWAPVAKFALLWMLSAVLCFGLAAPLARRIPLLGRIL